MANRQPSNADCEARSVRELEQLVRLVNQLLGMPLIDRLAAEFPAFENRDHL